VDAPVPELWPPACQDRPDGNRPLRVRLDLVVTQPFWEGTESPVRRQLRDDERRINPAELVVVPIPGRLSWAWR
jgi:hypothetical protein